MANSCLTQLGGLVHPVPIVLVAIFAEGFARAVFVLENDGGVHNTVEHRGLYCCIMYHVLENYLLPHLKWLGEAPTAHVIAAQTTVSTQTINVPNIRTRGRSCFEGKAFGPAHFWLVGHLQTVGHVAGERDIENGGLNAVVLDDIDDLRHKRPCLPGEGAARLEDDMQVGIATMQALQDMNKVFNVIVLARHQMSATKIKPFELWEPLAELRFKVLQCMLQSRGGTFAMTMTMETLDTGWQYLGQLLRKDTKATTRGTGIVKLGLYLAVFWVYTKSV